MHELSYCISLVDMACRQVDADKDRIIKINAEVGAMTGILPEYLEKYFPEASKGTAAEEATLSITSVPVEGVCLDCGTVYQPSAANNYSCPECKSLKFDLKHGREFNLIDIEVKQRM